MPGAVIGFMYSGAGPLPPPIEFKIPLEKALPPGTYRLFVKNFYHGSMEATLGDTTCPLTIRRYDWTPGVTFEPNTSFDKIVLRYFPGGSGGIRPNTGAKQEQYYIIQGVFLTNENDKVPIRGGEVISLLPEEFPPVIDGNYISNASFEVGIYPWGKAFETANLLAPHHLNSDNAVHGRYCLEFKNRNSFAIETPLLRLQPGIYTLSFYAKANQPASIEAQLLGLAEDLKNYKSSGLKKLFKIESQWKRYSVTSRVVARTGLLYTVRIRGKSNTHTKIWLDAVQLENGKLSDFKTCGAEVGYTCSTLGHIFYEDEAAEVELRVHNPAGSTQATVSYHVTDFWGNQIDKQMVTLKLFEGQGSIKIKPFQHSRGIFRIHFAFDKSSADMVYSVLPPNQHLGREYPDGTLGADSGFVAENLAILKRANFNWIITKSLGRWYAVEPEQGQFQFQDDAIDAARKNHLSTVIQFLNPSWGIQKWLKQYWKPLGGAAWLPKMKQSFMTQWAAFVYQTVSHYKEAVKHWEIWNEPNSSFNATEYAELLRLASQSIRKADSKAKVIAFAGGGFNQPFYEKVFKLVGHQTFDVGSVHLYGNELGAHRAFSEFMKKTGKPGWNTETGPTCDTFYIGLPNFDSISQKNYLQNLQKSIRRTAVTNVKNYLISLSIGGMKRYFHYFSRFSNSSPSQPTRWFGSGKEISEFDGSLRANCVGLSIASHFLDGTTYEGRISVHKYVEAHLFRKERSSIGFIWAKSIHKFLFNCPSGEPITFYDIMGNPIQRQDIVIDYSPLYVTSSAAPRAFKRMIELLASKHLRVKSTEASANTKESMKQD